MVDNKFKDLNHNADLDLQKVDQLSQQATGEREKVMTEEEEALAIARAHLERKRRKRAEIDAKKAAKSPAAPRDFASTRLPFNEFEMELLKKACQTFTPTKDMNTFIRESWMARAKEILQEDS